MEIKKDDKTINVHGSLFDVHDNDVVQIKAKGKDVEIMTWNKKNQKTCRTCKHRQRWQCGGSIISYCAIRPSRRTFNGLMKVLCNQIACDGYENS